MAPVTVPKEEWHFLKRGEAEKSSEDTWTTEAGKSLWITRVS